MIFTIQLIAYIIAQLSVHSWLYLGTLLSASRVGVISLFLKIYNKLKGLIMGNIYKEKAPNMICESCGALTYSSSPRPSKTGCASCGGDTIPIETEKEKDTQEPEK